MSAQPLIDWDEKIEQPPKPPVLAPVFSIELGEELKQRGMKKAADANPFLKPCRAAVRAAALGRTDRTATADDASRYLESIGHPADLLGNAAGSLFRGGEWEWTGRLQPSMRPSRHANQNRIWRLV